MCSVCENGGTDKSEVRGRLDAAWSSGIWMTVLGEAEVTAGQKPFGLHLEHLVPSGQLFIFYSGVSF